MLVLPVALPILPEVVGADLRAVPGAGGELPDGTLQRQEGAQLLSVGRRGIGPVGADVVPALRQALVGIAVLDDEAEHAVGVGGEHAVADRRAVVHHVGGVAPDARSEEHTSELQSLMRISYAVFCLKKKKKQTETS